MGYFVYVLYSDQGQRYYTGSCSDPELRLVFHNTKEKGFTSRYRPWRLVFCAEYPSKQSARQAERRIKSWKSPRMIERLIAGEPVLDR